VRFIIGAAVDCRRHHEIVAVFGGVAEMQGTTWMDWQKRIKQFFFPQFSRGYLLRVLAVAVCAFVFFRFFLTPAMINGESMEPTYGDGGISGCWHPKFWFREPRVGDVVMIRYAGREMLFKRVVAVAGETVEFRAGQLYVNGTLRQEPWVKFPCDWNRGPVKVEPGHVYVIGDNRSMPVENHKFGAVEVERILGGPPW
jgi:signal peptidase I